MEGEQDGEALARPRRRRRIAREQAVALPGMFTHVDLTVFNPPPNIREDAEELSNAAKALANTHLLATAFARFVEELGPVLKKLKPSGDSSRAASPEHVFSDYQSRWAEAAKKWLRTNITGSEGMGLVWHQFTSEEAKKVLTHSFFEANTLSIQDASLESYFIIKCGATFGQFKHHMKVLYQQAVFIYPFIGPAVLSLSLTHSHSLSLSLSHSLSLSLFLSLSLSLSLFLSCQLAQFTTHTGSRWTHWCGWCLPGSRQPSGRTRPRYRRWLGLVPLDCRQTPHALHDRHHHRQPIQARLGSHDILCQRRHPTW